MKEYTCVKDFYIEDLKFSSKGDTVRLLQDGVTVVNLNGGQKVAYASGILDNEQYFMEIPTEDNINHPIWYTSHPSGIECIDITRHYCFSIGCAFKYLWRAGLKGDNTLDKNKEIEDLKKAIWYINDRIKQLEKDNGKIYSM